MERKSPSLKVCAVDGDGLGGVIDLQRAGAADADLAHLPGDERRVRTDAAARGEDAFGGDHAAQIFGRGFDADEQDLLALGGGRDGAVGVEINLAGGGAGTGGQALGDAPWRPSPPCGRRRARGAGRAGRPGTRRMAVFQSMSFSFTMSMAKLHARPGRCACRCGSGA